MLESSSGSRAAMLEGLAWVAAAVAIAYFISEIDLGKVNTLVKRVHDATAATAAKSAQQGKATRKTAVAREDGDGEGSARGALSGVELSVGRDGHYHADAEINGRSAHVLVDTGASLVALTYEDAEAAGIFVKPSDFTHRSNTANGVAKFAPVVIDRIAIGDVTVRNVQAAVSERGKLGVTLLGMAFLNRLSRVEMREGKLVLQD